MNPLLAVLLCILALAGCTTLPTVAPQAPSTPATEVQLEGARGTLTPRQGEAVLAQLARNSDDTGIFERHLALEAEASGSPLVTGNRVQLLQDGPSTYRAMFAAIEAARDHVHMETYIIEDDEVGKRFSDALLAKRAQGVSVALVHDSVGTLTVPKAFFDRLRAAGVSVLEFNPVNPLTAKKGWEVNSRDHRKLLVIDGRVAFVGGVNISSVYAGSSFSSASRRRPDGAPPWRDTHLRIEGPVVAEFQRLFLETWEKQKGEPLAPRVSYPPAASAGGEVVRAIASSPEKAGSTIYTTLVSAIGAAETRILLTNAYFVPDAQLRTALIAAAARGVDVRLVLPGSTDSWMVFHAGRAHYAELLAGGVRLYERRDAMLHAKTAVIDGVWSTVGSSNLDARSFLHNDEVTAVVLGQAFGAQMQAMFDADVAAAREVTRKTWDERPLTDRAKEAMAGLWRHWL
jgi:cardiolipin synthase A/B